MARIKLRPAQPPLRSHLPEDVRRIAVLDRPGITDTADLLRGWYPDAAVELLDATLQDREREAALTALRPWDAVLDVSHVRRGRVRRMLGAFHLLRPGGVFVLDADDVDAEKLVTGQVGRWDRSDRTQGAPVDDLAHFRAALASHDRVGQYVVLTSRGSDVHAKLDEPRFDELLALRPRDDVHELSRIPAESFTPRGVLREWPESRDEHPIPTRYDAPDVVLRDYSDVVVAPGQLVCKDGLVLPDSFRHNQRRRLVSRAAEEVAPLFARPGFDETGLERLPGTYLHLDNELRGHFGHVLTEQVSRLWTLAQARALAPDLKVIVSVTRGREIASWERILLGAAGVERDDLVVVREPVRVERLISGGPLLSHPEYIHPRIAETWLEVGDRLAAEATSTDLPARIFCSRALGKRACRNQEEVEQLFTDQGFTVVFPEQFPLGDQVAMFRNAEVVAGFSGSAMFTLCFAPEPTRVVMVGSERYTARNEFMIAAVLGHEIDSFLCRPEREDWFQSAFVFDHDREGRDLARVFTTLGKATA